ncbi:MAG: hypothetical protein J6S85_16800 [Methanobrevibacter sp.]|nr:hypothetical protein [Methanobrevibacter sp.]
MKYIRTKDRIWDTSKLCKDNQNWYYLISNDFYVFCENEIIKQADTIEELCNEFVVAYEEGERMVYCDLEWAKVKAKASLQFGYKSIIYGAIWTNKGLIYVAKMNEEGNLELL